MEYKKYLFSAPSDWDIKKCAIKYDNGKMIIERQVSCYISEVCKADLLDGDDFEIKELDDWQTKAVIQAGR